MNERVNPFGDLRDFAPAPVKQKPPVDERAVIEQVAAENNFPSRHPSKPPAAPYPSSVLRTQRRYTTGRNMQINIKATAQTIDRLHRVADELGVPLGEVLARALEALEQGRKSVDSCLVAR
jgi:hypothetical protein